MVRNIVAFVVGMIAGMAFNMALITVNESLFDKPAGMDPNDMEAMKAWVATLPAHGFLLVMLAHIGQAVVGGWIAARFCKSRPLLWSMIIGVLTALGSAIVLPMLGSPIWMWVEVPIALGAAWYIGSAENKRRAALPAAA